MGVARSIGGLLAATSLLATVACASGGQADSPDPFAGGSASFDGPVRMTIQNNDYRDATVYGYWNGVRERIGMVIGKTTKTFQTTWKSETFSFHVDFVGGGEYRSESIEVWPDDHLDFVIMAGW